MITTDYDLAFCNHALYRIYDELIDEQDIEYYCNILAVAINKTNFDEVKKLWEQNKKLWEQK